MNSRYLRVTSGIIINSSSLVVRIIEVRAAVGSLFYISYDRRVGEVWQSICLITVLLIGMKMN